MVAGAGRTVTVVVAEHPESRRYEMSDVPVATPVTTPDVDPIVATLVVVLDHLPPVDASLSVVVDPTHTLSVPVIGLDNVPTVTVNMMVL